MAFPITISSVHSLFLHAHYIDTNIDQAVTDERTQKETEGQH